MKRNIVLALLGLVIFSTLSSKLSHAQGLGSIAGTITDPTGAAIASAQITVTQIGTGLAREATTDAEGYYVVPSVRPAEYTVVSKARGFSDARQNVTLLADQTLTVNLQLKVGSGNEIIEVQGNAPQVDTMTSTMRQVVEQARITELPLNGRNAAQLTLLSSGSVSSPNGGADQGFTKTFPGAVTISANGARQNMVSYQLDGGNFVDEYTNVNQPFPFPDALQEFSVQTSNYTAEYGQNAGAVVNVITKSGTNDFHGNVFEFLRNSVFNARNYFAPLKFSQNGTLVPTKDNGRDQIKRNQFGGTFGGPIIHNRTFFFAGYQETRFRNVGSPANSTIPTTVLTSIPASGPVTSSCMTCDLETYLNTGGPGGTAGTIDPVSLNILAGLPLSTSRAVTYLKPDDENFREALGRVDHSFTQSDRLSVRYGYNQFKRDPVFDPTNFLAYADGATITNQNYLIHENHIFRPTLLNDFRFSYAREAASRGPAADVPSVQSLGSNIPFQPPTNAIQQIRVNGFFNFGDNPNATFIRNNFSWSDDVSWVKGRHDFRFGGVIERSRVDLNNLFFQPAEFSFASLSGFLSGGLGDYSGNLAFRQGAGEFKNNRNIFAGVYGQDNIRVSRRLTVNLGLRYEPALPWRELKGRVQQFRINGLIAGVRSTQFPNAPPGAYFPGDPGVPPNGINASLNNFAPRIGFAYDVFGDGKTSLRGGGGIFYDTRISGIINNRFVDQAPFSPQLIFSTTAVKSGSISDPLCIQATTQASLGCTAQNNLFPAPFPPPKDSTFAPGALYLSWDPNHKYQVPTVYNWNLALEHQLPLNLLLRTAYVGSRSTHLTETLNLDPAPPSATGAVGKLRLNAIAAAQGITKPPFSQVQQDMQDVNSIYHSFQVSVEKRASHGLTVLGSYTYSRSIDDLPAGAGVTGFDVFSARPWDDPLRHRFDYGPSDFDHTHRFVASYVWVLPTPAKGNGFLRGVFGGWQLGGVVSAQTGRPFTVLQGQEISGTGIGQDRATLIAGSDPFAQGACAAAGINTGSNPKPCVDWLNKASFATKAQAAGSFGNTGKNGFRLPGAYTWDMNTTKNFRFTERWRLEFRAEFFNVFNRANFMDDSVLGVNALPNFQKVSASSFGAIQQASDPRIGQLALKLYF